MLALDVDPAMLEYIARDVLARGLSNVDTTRVPFDSPGLADGSVDLLFLSNTLHHIQDRAHYYPQMIDALRPGGRIAIVDFFKRALPVGPQSVDHKLAKSSVVREFTESGLRIVQDIEELPHQYFLVARPFPAFLNARLVSQDLATGGQPSPEDLTRLRDLGYRTIPNLRRPDEGSNEEGDRVRELGMTYLNIPIGGEPIIPQQVGRFTAALTDSANYPMLVHCASANRVGGLFYLHRVVHEDHDKARALAEARSIGLKPSLEAALNTYLENHQP